MPASKFRITLCQLAVGTEKVTNVKNAVRLLTSAIESHPTTDLLVLPECFNSPYGVQHFPVNAESFNASPTLDAIGDFASRHRVHVLAGSIPELAEDGLIYNTSALIAPSGAVIGKYRKVHLFKLNTPKLKFDESETLAPGDSLLCFDLPARPAPSSGTPEASTDARIVPLPPHLTALRGTSTRTGPFPDPPSAGTLRVGVGICFDVRYPAFAATYAHALHCDALVYPGAFNMVTGPPHWELAARSRAVDTQTYVAMVSPARTRDSGYVSFAHSLVVNAWGEVTAQAGEMEEVISSEICLEHLRDVRGKLPTRPGAVPGFDVWPVPTGGGAV